MDPNETLRLIHEQIKLLLYAERIELRELCMTLYAWLNRGGFEPVWRRYPIASNYYHGLDIQYLEGGE